MFRPLQYMGMNAILVFFWHGPASALIHAIYLTTGPDPTDDSKSNTRYTLIWWLKNDAINYFTQDKMQIQFVLYL